MSLTAIHSSTVYLKKKEKKKTFSALQEDADKIKELKSQTNDFHLRKTKSAK